MEILRDRDWPSRPGTIFQMPPCKEGQRRDTWLAGEGCEEELPWKAPGDTGRRFAIRVALGPESRMSSGIEGSPSLHLFH